MGPPNNFCIKAAFMHPSTQIIALPVIRETLLKGGKG